MNVGAGGRDHGVWVGPLAVHSLAVFFQTHRDFGLCVGPVRHGMDLVQLQG